MDIFWTWMFVMVILPFIIGMMGEIAKKLALPMAMPPTGYKGWRGVYYVTFRGHALAVGALCGLGMHASGIPIPVEVFGEELGGYAAAGTFSGGVAMIAYEALVGTIKAFIKQLSRSAGGE